MTVVKFHVVDQSGNNVSGIQITGVTDWGGPLGIGSGNQPYTIVTDSSGQASEDNGNGIWGGSGTYTATGTGYQSQTGDYSITGNAGEQDVVITVLSTTGSGSTPQTHIPTTTIVLIVGTAAAVIAAIGIALVRK